LGFVDFDEYAASLFRERGAHTLESSAENIPFMPLL
jgi:hypothetical protein